LSSNRDPLAEFSEWLVARLVEGRLATSRVQAGFDVIGPSGDRIQVKYLANPKGEGAWTNEHEVRFDGDLDAYAIVFFSDLELESIVMFTRDRLEEVGRALDKRHPNQGFTLQLTRRNRDQILRETDRFRELGVRAYVPSEELGWEGHL
jgi:hypothetical protein